MRFLLPLIFIGTAVLVLFSFVEPLYRDVQGLQAQNEELDDAVARTQELTAIRERLTTKYQSFSLDEFARISKLLPDTIDNIQLILDVDEIARQNALRIRDIAVSTEEPSNGNGRARGGDSGGAYDTMRMSFSTEASYSAFLAFLTDLERSLRLVDVIELSVTEGEGGGSSLSYSVTLQAYWLK